MTWRWVRSVEGLALAAAGCGGAPDEPALVRVGEMAITAADLKAFVAGLPEWTRSDLEGEARTRDYLQSLVDRALILQEARERGLDGSPEVAARVESDFDSRLARQVEARRIEAEVEVTDEEVERAYRERGWDRSLRVAHIFVRSDSLKERVQRELRSGRSFESVARSLSEDPPSAARGGLMPNYYTRASATPAVRDALFALATGQVSDPIPIDTGYEIFKVLDQRQVDLADTRERVLAELRGERLSAAFRQHLDSLAVAYQLDPPAGGPGWRAEVTRMLAREARDAGLADEPENRRWLVRKREEILILAVRQVEAGNRVSVSDSEVSRFYAEHLERYRNADEVAYIEVMLADHDEAADLIGQVRRVRQSSPRLLSWVEEVRRRVVAGQEVDESVARLASTLDPAGQEPALGWLVRRLAAPVERLELAAQMSLAVSAEDLAQQVLMRYSASARSIRPGGREIEGHYHIRYVEGGAFAPLLEAVMAAEEGAVVGPVAVEGGFCALKLLMRKGGAVLPLAQVEARIRRSLAERRENELFHAWLAELRRRRAPEVTWYDDAIRQAAVALDGDRKDPSAAGPRASGS